jgi:penicillin-binding protein 1A
MLAGAQAMAARAIRISRYARTRCRKPAAGLLLFTTLIAVTVVGIGFYHIYLDRTNLPDLEPFVHFDFPTIGHVYDINGQPLIEMATEHRWISRYEDIPPVVSNAILAAEDKNFFSHNGVDYSSIPRVLSKLRIRSFLGRFTKLGRRDAVNSSPIFPQGGSTITQQLVRGYFLQTVTARENSNQLRRSGFLARGLSYLIGARSVNMVVRKVEEIRLALWLEKTMQERFGSKRRAKEEILARYVSLVYMGNGQYGLARAADYYFGRSLASFTADDADKAALLAGAIKSARYYAPTGSEIERVRQRRNQVLALMAANGSLPADFAKKAKQRPIEVVAKDNSDRLLQSSAIVENVLEELKTSHADLSVKDLLQGRIQVYSTADARVQEIVTQALEHGLLLYEKRHPGAKGLIQGSVVVLRNRDASILAEAGGRQVYQDRSVSYSDLNRATKSLRQPGSAMKPIVYLAAFRAGTLNLDSVVPDEPISVPNGPNRDVKWISNYDGQFKGMIPARIALAESRNAVAIWIAGEIGIASVLRTARNLGIQTPLQPYVTTALGASEVTLMELANAYRTMASGLLTQPYVIRRIVLDSGQVLESEHASSPIHVEGFALLLIQEGMRGVVRLPTGTAHALDSSGFPIAVMGKTGTTNEFRDALFVGSTYGPEGITIAVRIGFDDNRSLRAGETGGRAALPVFKEIALRVYAEKLVGTVPQFPAEMEQSINHYLDGGVVKTIAQR